MLTPHLCRASRALLGWTIEDLAATSRVGTSTIVSFETGQRSPIRANLDALARTFTDAGVLFLDADENGTGLRLRRSAEVVRDLLVIGARKEPIDVRLRRAQQRIGRFRADAKEFYAAFSASADELALRVDSETAKVRDQLHWEIERRAHLRRDDDATRSLEPIIDILHARCF